MHRYRFRCILLVAAALLAMTTLRAEDWPRWRGPNGDARSPETGLMSQWPEGGPPQVWTAPLGLGYSAVSVADGRAVTQFQADQAQWVVAFDAASGKRLWIVRSGGAFHSSPDYPGARATPTIEDDRVYAVDAAGNLLCLKAADGAEVWKANVLKLAGSSTIEWGISGSPLIDGNRLIVYAGESNGGASVLALDKMTGEVVWKALSDKSGYSTPVIHTPPQGPRQMLHFVASGLVSTDPESGRVLWRHPWKTSYDVNAATPIAWTDQVFITSGYNVGAAVLNIPAPGGEPTELWRNREIRSQFGTPVRIDDKLYGFDMAMLVCIDWSTGERHWRSRGLGKGTLIWADGLFYILGERGDLVLAQLSPEGMTAVSRVDGLMQGHCWTMPVIANGRLYLRDQERLVCLDIRADGP